MKTWGIIGAICFAIAVAFGYFFKFDGSTPIAIASGAFGFTAIVIGAVNEGKSKNVKTWITVIVIVASALGGVLCYIGNVSDKIFATISGAVIALLAVIFGIVTTSKTKEIKQ